MNNYLNHHGIRRQRWGVRRFQNYDGSLTEAGRERAKMHNKGASKAKRFDTDRYMNANNTPTYLGRQKFDVKKHKKKRNRSARVTADTMMIMPITGSAVSRGRSAAAPLMSLPM